MAILDNLISFWELEEASGTRVDSHGSMDLSDNSTVTQNTGKVGNAAEFTKANHEYLSHADHADLEPGDADFTFTAWVYFTTGLGAYPVILAKDSDPSNYSYTIYYQTNTAVWFRMSPDGTGASTVTLNVNGTLTLSTWYFICAQYDAGANQMSLSVNNGTVQTASETGGAYGATSEFRIGDLPDGNDADAYMNGRIDQVGFWKRKITADEITWLYNSGNGRAYSEFTTPITVNLTSNLNG